MRRQVGTPYYLAPEVARGDKYNEKCDVYSFGVLLLEMCFRHGLREAFTGLGGMAAVHKVAAGWQPELPPYVQHDLPVLGSLIRRCLHAKFRERPAIANVVAVLGSLKQDTSDERGLLSNKQPAPPLDARKQRRPRRSSLVMETFKRATQVLSWSALRRTNGHGAPPIPRSHSASGDS